MSVPDSAQQYNQQQFAGYQDQNMIYQQQSAQAVYPPQSPQPVYVDQTQQAYYNSAGQQQVYPNAVQSQAYAYQPTYNYDLNNINYQQMSVEQWNSVPAEQTQYSQYWSTQQAFEPATFSENTKKESKCNDIACTIIFLVHLVATIVIGIVICVSNQNKDSSSSAELLQMTLDVNLTMKIIYYAVGIGIAIAVILNILHMVYMIFAPVFYIKFGFFVSILILAVICVVCGYFAKVIWVVAIPAFFLLVALCCYCCLRKRMAMSAMMMKYGAKLLLKNPSIFLLLIIESVISLGLSVFFSFMITYIVLNNWSYYIYLYIAFSYFWCTLLLGYLVYTCIAGVAAQWYFLNDTEYYPKHPVWTSLKRCMTTSFGSIALASGLLALVQLLRLIADQAQDDAQGVVAILICIARCILCIIEACLKFITQYALIYVAIYGVPFVEGCRRFAEQSSNRFADILLNSCIIDISMGVNQMIFAFGSVGVGIGLGFLFKFESSNYPNIFFIVFCPIVAFVICLSLFEVLKMPICTMADTIMVCFCESPDRCKTTAAELGQSLSKYYSDELEKRIKKSKSKGVKTTTKGEESSSSSSS